MHGTSGSGKTTLAARIAERLDVTAVELDAIYHQADWTPLPTDEFRRRVAALASGETWVIEGNYSAVRDLVWASCDLAVVHDLPRWVTTTRVLRRSWRRVLQREELWNANTESLSALVSFDPERNPVLWSWMAHAQNQGDLPTGARSAGVPDVVVLCSSGEIDALLDALGQTL